MEIWRNREVVEDDAVENPNTQIAVSEVKAIDSTYEVGDEYSDQIKMNQFGRRAVLSLRQNLASRLLDLEKANIYEKYSQKVGEIITGEVYQVWKREVLLLDDEENEMILPKSEQIPNDFYRKGDTIKAELFDVQAIPPDGQSPLAGGQEDGGLVKALHAGYPGDGEPATVFQVEAVRGGFMIRHIKSLLFLLL